MQFPAATARSRVHHDRKLARVEWSGPVEVGVRRCKPVAVSSACAPSSLDTTCSTRMFWPKPGHTNFPFASRNQFTLKMHGGCATAAHVEPVLEIVADVIPAERRHRERVAPTPTAPAAAAVVSEPIVAALYTPSSTYGRDQRNGVRAARRNKSGNRTLGSSHARIKRRTLRGGHRGQRALVRCLATVPPSSGVLALPVDDAGACFVMPSHHTSPSSVSATLVK